jgi:peptidoglycan/xylan/chitin deacetylase (PgdA/CDA1 family)
MIDMRLDRALSIGVARPLLRLKRQSRGAGIPILMYHGIRRNVGDRHPYYETNTSPERFAAQMKYLRDSGYETIGLDEITGDGGNASNNRRNVVVTFDDGYRDFYTEAFPVLVKYGFKAIVYVVSGFARMAATTEHPGRYMTWDDLREIQRHGMTIGSHTASHCQLLTTSASNLYQELADSKRIIENELGVQIRSFAYPFAFPEHERAFIDTLRSLLKQCRYVNGVSTSIGTVRPGSDPFFLPRIPVNSYDDTRFLEAKLNGAYNWVHVPQFAYKCAMMRFRAPASVRSASIQPNGEPENVDLRNHHASQE